ncbi:DUF927 domain-containing protein [Brevundimonas sp.]|uniref:DUF927 domain-containing protein n=1 Tax=Brevundimonas sp. TaxID=1871086 RepID=UPI00286BA266|nr:DUF927 domain-containing protein [Brevundimonas sp.]
MSGSDDTDPFARITPDAIDGDEGAKPAKDHGELIAPVPGEAPALPDTWRGPGDVLAKWPYRDAAGRILRWTLRFARPDGEKDIRPATLWRATDGKLKWRFAAGGDGRPLYGLDRLAAHPDAPVLIVEGEKTSDAAQARFPAFVAMTWPGGSNAVSKADMAPLIGRTIVVWPDADEAGRKAAEAIRRAATSAGAHAVRLVELPSGLPKGWDLADDWPPFLDEVQASALLDAALQACRSETVVPWGYRGDATGWYWAPPGDSKGGDGPPPPMWLSSPFQLAASARDEDGLDWSLVLDFRDPDGRTKREIIGKSELAGDATDVRRRLMGAGLQLATNRAARERLQSLLGAMISPARARLVSSTGWKGEIYVLPHRSIGAMASTETVIFRGRSGGTYHGEAGSYGAWRAEVAAPMSGNAIGLFAMSAAFAGPLMRPLHAEGGGFHFRGGSSTAKTTVLRVAGSVCGGGGPIGFLQSWRNTDNALEAVALAHNDGMLALDELRALSPEAAGAAAYALATGATKGRLRADAELRARPSWRVMILSTGELSLSDLISLTRSKDKTYAGQELRLIDIAVDMEAPGTGGKSMGAWETIHGAVSPAAFSDTVKEASAKHYGHALPIFLERYLTRKAEMLAAAEQIQADFLADVLRPGDHGQAHRAAQRFAVVAAAGELAALMDVVPWGPGEAAKAAATLFGRWAKTFGRETQREDREAIQRVRAFIERFESSRFRLLKEGSETDPVVAEGEDCLSKQRDGEARSLDSAGWKGFHAGRGLVFHFNTEFMKSEVFGGMSAHAALLAIRAAGYLISNGEATRLTNKISVPGVGKRNVYSILGTLMDDEDFTDEA